MCMFPELILLQVPHAASRKMKIQFIIMTSAFDAAQTGLPEKLSEPDFKPRKYWVQFFQLETKMSCFKYLFNGKPESHKCLHFQKIFL